MSSNTSSEGEIRAGLIEADLVDCMVALLGQFLIDRIASTYHAWGGDKGVSKYEKELGYDLA